MRHLSVSSVPKSGKTVHLPQSNSTPPVNNIKRGCYIYSFITSLIYLITSQYEIALNQRTYILLFLYFLYFFPSLFSGLTIEIDSIYRSVVTTYFRTSIFSSLFFFITLLLQFKNRNRFNLSNCGYYFYFYNPFFFPGLILITLFLVH